MNSKKPAFTMLELIMVIVVLGILVSLALPRMDRDIRQEAGDNILTAIRHTQQMALIDNVTDSNNSSWQRAFWRFGFSGCSDDGIFYYIASDSSTLGGINAGEEAVDPISGYVINGLTNQPCEFNIDDQTRRAPSIFISQKYGITDGNIAWGGSCTGNAKYIGFDYLGRPHRGFTASTSPNYASILTSDCTLTLTFDSGDAPLVITIEKGTGHAYIVGQPDS